MYYVVYGLMYLLSLIPWRILYFLSDAIYGLVYYVFGYRRAVVMSNLNLAFPEKTEKEKIRIAKDFYHNFIDTFIEIVKLISISREEFHKRFSINKEVIDSIYDTGQNVEVISGHFFNWEFLSMGLSASFRYQWLGVYIPISNKIFHKIMIKMRTKFGAILIPATEFRTVFPKHTKKPYILGLVADQNPGDPNFAFWYPFFGKLTPFVKGPDKAARTLNAAVVAVNLYKVKRGYYHMDCTLITKEPKKLPEGAIIKELVHFLEDAIRQRPANYLWSHRRWKFEFDPGKQKHLLIK